MGDRISAVHTAKVAPVVAPFLALCPDTKYKLKGWMIEGKWDSADLLRLRLEVVLCLHDNLLKVGAAEFVSLLLIKVTLTLHLTRLHSYSTLTPHPTRLHSYSTPDQTPLLLHT